MQWQTFTSANNDHCTAPFQNNLGELVSVFIPAAEKNMKVCLSLTCNYKTCVHAAFQHQEQL